MRENIMATSTTTKRSPNWSEDETTLALALYVQIPFGKISHGNPYIQALAQAIGRTPSSVSLKLSNLARLDPKLQSRGVAGMSHGSRTDQLVWEQFSGANTQTTDLAPLFDAADQAASRLGIATEDYVITPLTTEQQTKINNLQTISETERRRMTKVRIHQNMFRDAVLSSYGWQCAVTGLSEPQLIEAAHIREWSQCEGAATRLSPANGIALASSIHRAYDCNLVGITPDLICIVSPALLKRTPEGTPSRSFFQSINGRALRLPDRFQPNRDCLSDRYAEFRAASDASAPA